MSRYDILTLREISITGYCEYCFDDITAEPDEEEEPA